MNQQEQKTINPLKGVLYIDDDAGNIYLIHETLKKCQLPLIMDFARSLEEALEIFDSSKHDLILTDYNLGSETAPDVARTFLEKHPKLIVIAFSEAYTDKHIELAKAAGIKECFEKTNPETCLKHIMEQLS